VKFFTIEHMVVIDIVLVEIFQKILIENFPFTITNIIVFELFKKKATFIRIDQLENFYDLDG